METIFVGWFTFIFVTRLLLAPDKVKCLSLFLAIYIKLSLPPLSDTIFYELFKHHRSVWNFTLLHLCPPEPSQLPIFSRVDDEGSPDIPHFENTPNIQIVPTHHRAQDTRAHPQKQPQVWVRINPPLIPRYCYHTPVNHWFYIIIFPHPPGSYCFSPWL